MTTNTLEKNTIQPSIIAAREQRGNIREARPEEALLLSNLALRSKGYWGYDEQFLEECRDDLRITSKYITTCPVFVMEVDERIVGFYGLRWQPGNTVELADLFIDPDFIGRGYGRRLWQHAVRTATALYADQLLVHSDPHAEGFYRAMGARHIGEVPSSAIEGRVLPLMQFAL